MIGDGKNDILAGGNAGTRTGLIINGKSLENADVQAEIVGSSLSEIITKLYEERKLLL